MADSRIAEGDWSAKNDDAAWTCAIFRAGFEAVL
jgi:hypothetical protein